MFLVDLVLIVDDLIFVPGVRCQREPRNVKGLWKEIRMR